MAIIEPMTDAAKALRELLGALKDIIELFDKYKERVELNERKLISKHLTKIYFEESEIPQYLLTIIDVEKLIRDEERQRLWVANITNDKELTNNPPSASELIIKDRHETLQALTHRLHQTEYKVVEALAGLAIFDDFIRERFGFAYSRMMLKNSKQTIREKIKRFKSGVELRQLTEEQVAEEGNAIVAMINEFNTTVQKLHDKLLNIEQESQ